MYIHFCFLIQYELNICFSLTGNSSNIVYASFAIKTFKLNLLHESKFFLRVDGKNYHLVHSSQACIV